MVTQTRTAARVLPPTTRRRATTVVLAAGTVLAAAAAFGPVWVVRAGLAVAIAAAITTTVLAWREVKADRRAHAAAMLAASKAHGESLRIERSHNSAVLQVVTDRNVAAMAEITRQQAVVAQLRGEISALKGDRAALTAEISRREIVIADLRATVRTREDELDSARAAAEAAAQAAAESAAEAAEAAARVEALTAVTEHPDDAGDEDAEVHAMPRRVLVDADDQPRRANRLEGARNEATIELDVNGLDRGPERSVDNLEWHEPVLPNYEEDRRLA